MFIVLLMKVIGQGAISAPMFAMKGPSMVEGQYPTAFPLKHQQKVCPLAYSLHKYVTKDVLILIFIRSKFLNPYSYFDFNP